MDKTEIIVNKNMGLVYSMAKKFLNRGVEYDDLVQIGSIGLIKAAEKFDEKLGYKFSTYAVSLIIGEIKRFLRDDGMIKVSRKLKEMHGRVNRSKEKLKQSLGREANLSEICIDTGLTEEDVISAIDSVIYQQSIYDTIGDDDSLYVVDLLRSSEDMQVEEKIYIQELIDKLDERSKNVIILRFFHDCTQQQVANVMKLSQVQVSRIEKRAIDLMKNYV